MPPQQPFRPARNDDRKRPPGFLGDVTGERYKTHPLTTQYLATPAGQKYAPSGGGGSLLRGVLGGLGGGALWGPPGMLAGGALGLSGGSGGGDFDKAQQNVAEMMGTLMQQGLSESDARTALRQQFKAEATMPQGGSLGPKQTATVEGALSGAGVGPEGAGTGVWKGAGPSIFFETIVKPYADSKYQEMMGAADQYEAQMLANAQYLSPAAQQAVATYVPQIAGQMRQQAGTAFSQFLGTDPTTSWMGRILESDRRYNAMAEQLAGGSGGMMMDPAMLGQTATYQDPFLMGAFGGAETGGYMSPTTFDWSTYGMPVWSGGTGRNYSAGRSIGNQLDDLFTQSSAGTY